ncbi:MAG: hypothetical protein GXO59_03550 [Dictyoglomi bacterium]|nr:hypothetical protein [Dictyoglomota bacterium]
MQQNRGILITLSLLFTLALWFAMSQTITPYTERVFTGVKIQIRGLGDDRVILSDVPLVNIRVRGPEDIVSTMPQPVAWVMIPAGAVGDVVLSVNVDLPSSVNLIDISPSSVALRIDVIKYKNVKIEVLTASRTDITSQFEILPPRVSIKGPSSIVNSIAKAVIVLDKMPKEAIKVSASDLMLIDVSGKPKDKKLISIEPSEIKLSPFTIKQDYLQLPVIPVIKGYAQGEYVLAGMKIDPSFAVVKTSTDNLPVSFIKTATIDLHGEYPSSIEVSLNDKPLQGLASIIYPPHKKVTIRFLWQKTKVYKIKTMVNGTPWIVMIRCPDNIEPPPDIVDDHGNVKTNKLPDTCVVIYSGVY